MPVHEICRKGFFAAYSEQTHDEQYFSTVLLNNSQMVLQLN